MEYLGACAAAVRQATDGMGLTFQWRRVVGPEGWSYETKLPPGRRLNEATKAEIKAAVPGIVFNDDGTIVIQDADEDVKANLEVLELFRDSYAVESKMIWLWLAMSVIFATMIVYYFVADSSSVDKMLRETSVMIRWGVEFLWGFFFVPGRRTTP
jgi:hypothetical protein